MHDDVLMELPIIIIDEAVVVIVNAIIWDLA